MSDVYNLLDGALDAEEEKPGYSHRRSRVGERLGAELLGATIYETPPGEKLWPYHWELGCEEFLVVVSGSPTLRTPEGERVLAPGDLVAFPEGEAGAKPASAPGAAAQGSQAAQTQTQMQRKAGGGLDDLLG